MEDKLGKWQYGFRPGKSTIDLIFALKMMCEKNWEWNKEVYACFIDLEKAFDRVDRSKLWEVLRKPEYNIDPKLIRVIMSIYKITNSKVKSKDIESEWFRIGSGVRQGGVLSPLLFIIFMDSCLKEICTTDETTFAYADDVAVITASIIKLQEAMDRWNNVLNEKGLRVNKNKTEVMKISRRNEECNIQIENHRLNQVSQFTYLGVVFNEQNKQEAEINNRIKKYNGNLSAMYPLLKDRNIPVKVKLIIFNTILKPILTYAAETWSLTTKTSSQIQAAEMKTLRLILGVTRRDRIRNTVIRERLGVEPVLDTVEKSRLRWYGHVQRMPADEYPKHYLNWTPQGRRPVGRPRMRWMQGVERALESRGLSLEQVNQQEVYEHREDWRRIVRLPTDRI